MNYLNLTVNQTYSHAYEGQALYLGAHGNEFVFLVNFTGERMYLNSSEVELFISAS